MDMQILTEADLVGLTSLEGFIIPQVLTSNNSKWSLSLCAPGLTSLHSRRIFIQCAALNGRQHAVPKCLSENILHVVVQMDQDCSFHSTGQEPHYLGQPMSRAGDWAQTALDLYIKVLQDLRSVGANTEALVVMGDCGGVMSGFSLVTQIMRDKYEGIAVHSCFLFSGAYTARAAEGFARHYDRKVAVYVVRHSLDTVSKWEQQTVYWEYLALMQNVHVGLFKLESRVLFGERYQNVASIVMSTWGFWEIVCGSPKVMSLDLTCYWHMDPVLQIASTASYSLLLGVRLSVATWSIIWNPVAISDPNWQSALDQVLLDYSQCPMQTSDLFFQDEVERDHIGPTFLSRWCEALREGLKGIMKTGKTDIKDNTWKVSLVAREHFGVDSGGQYSLMRFDFKGPLTRYQDFKIYNSEVQTVYKAAFSTGSILIVHAGVVTGKITTPVTFSGAIIDTRCRAKPGKKMVNALASFDMIMYADFDYELVYIYQIEVIPMRQLESW